MQKSNLCDSASNIYGVRPIFVLYGGALINKNLVLGLGGQVAMDIFAVEKILCVIKCALKLFSSYNLFLL